MFGMAAGIGLSFVALGVQLEKETETDVYISVPEEMFDANGRQKPLSGKEIASGFRRVFKNKTVRYRVRKGERLSYKEGTELAKRILRYGDLRSFL